MEAQSEAGPRPPGRNGDEEERDRLLSGPEADEQPAWTEVDASLRPLARALLALAGGRNVFGDRPDRYPTISPDDLRAADPALVLLSSEPFPYRDRHADELAALTGLPRERFRLVDGELLSWHGSRTPRGIDYAEVALAPPPAAVGR